MTPTAPEPAFPAAPALAGDAVRSVRPGLATWLGVLFAMLVCLNTLGGWVRLSGAGVAIPQWPLIALDGGRWTLLPPMDAAGWASVKAHYDADQLRLQELVLRGELVTGNRGRQPRDLADFQAMFLTEWSHRLLAALVAVVAAACLTVALRDAHLRRLAGGPLLIAGGLIIAQAVLGGLLVHSGTNTRWLFLHQGNAALILGCVLWALMRLIADGQRQATTSERTARRWPQRLIIAALIAVWMQILGGALVAGSRFNDVFSTDFPRMFGALVPPLWHHGRDVAGNLLDNAVLHQWLHRWSSWLVVGLVVAAAIAVRHSAHSGPRLRLALPVALTFVGILALMGIANVLLARSDGSVQPSVALGHQLMASCLFASLVVALFAVRHEPDASTSAPGEHAP